jgi:hypothetical protein
LSILAAQALKTFNILQEEYDLAMNKWKLLLRLFIVLVVFAPLSYFGYLNQEYFLQTVSFHLYLGEPAPFDYHTPSLSNAFYWSICGFIGLLVAALYAIPGRVKLKRQLKKLHTENQNLKRQLEEQTEKTNALKAESLSAAPTTAEESAEVEQPAVA